MKKIGKVYFIGAGPGDPELITVKAKKIIQKADLIIYAGSLVPKQLITPINNKAKILDSSRMNINEIYKCMVEAVAQGNIVARIHSGDPSVYGAINEQMFLLEKDAIPYEIVPGITAAFALAAEAKVSLTIPESIQTVIFTRTSGKTVVPEKQRLKRLASHNAAIAIYLSSLNPSVVKDELIKGGYNETAQVIIGHKIGWPDQKIIRCNLKDMDKIVEKEKIKRQTIFLVIPKIEKAKFSKLYTSEFSHEFRKGS